MSREGVHFHACGNKAHGCTSTYQCSDEYLKRDGSSLYCTANPMNEAVCEDCDTSRCSDCGAVLHIDTHDADCAKATQV